MKFYDSLIVRVSDFPKHKPFYAINALYCIKKNVFMQYELLF